MGIVGEVGQTGLPKKVDEPAQESNHLKLVTEPHKFVTRNLIAIPIFIRGKLFGVVELLNCAGKASYSDSDFQKAIYLVQEFWVHAIEARLMHAFQPQKSQAS
jgi:GAF domain-containing protein